MMHRCMSDHEPGVGGVRGVQRNVTVRDSTELVSTFYTVVEITRISAD